VFSSVIDGLDRDTEMMKGIKKMIAEGKVVEQILVSSSALIYCAL
jgi:hypothetical protein